MLVTRFALQAVLLSSSCFAQTTAPSLKDVDLPYFRYLFMGIANPNDDPAIARQRESALVVQFGLDAEQAQALHQAAVDYRRAIQQLQQESFRKVREAGGEASPALIVSLEKLVAQRDAITQQLAVRLIAQLGPDVAIRLRPGKHQ